MLRRMVVGVVALSLVVLSAATASAVERPFKIGVGGGLSVPVSDAGSALDNGFHAKGIFQWKVPVLPFSIGTSLGYEKFNLSSLTAVTGSSRIVSALGNINFGIPVGPIKTYLTAGLGAYKLGGSVNGVPVPSETKFGIDGGAGVEFKLGGVSAFVEGRMENIYTDQGINQSLNTQIVPVTFGILF